MLISEKRTLLLVGTVCAKALGWEHALLEDGDWQDGYSGRKRDRRIKCVNTRKAGVMGYIIWTK